MPSLSNPEHQIILDTCARAHVLTPQYANILRSLYIRAERALLGEAADGDVYHVEVKALSSGKAASATHVKTGMSVQLTKEGTGVTQLRVSQLWNAEVTESRTSTTQINYWGPLTQELLIPQG